MITVIAYFQELFSFSFVIVKRTCKVCRPALKSGLRLLALTAQEGRAFSRSSNMLAQSLLRNVTTECRSGEVDRGLLQTLSLAEMFDF